RTLYRYGVASKLPCASCWANRPPTEYRNWPGALETDGLTSTSPYEPGLMDVNSASLPPHAVVRPNSTVFSNGVADELSRTRPAGLAVRASTVIVVGLLRSTSGSIVTANGPDVATWDSK